MNRSIVFIIFSLFAIGCNVSEATEYQSKSPTKTYVINTITCLTREGWVDYKTDYSIYSSYSGRNSMWRFKSTDGKTLTFSTCYAEGK